MGSIGSGFKNSKACMTLLAKRFSALPDAEPPLVKLYVTPQTLANALSLVISDVCYYSTDIMIKGKASLLYESLREYFAKMDQEEFTKDLIASIGSYLPVFNATAAEAQRAPLPSAAQPAASAAPPGTNDADCLLGLAEVKPSVDVQVVASAGH